MTRAQMFNTDWLLIPAFLLTWSSSFAVAGIALDRIAPMSMLSLRFTIAAAIAALIAWGRRERWPPGRALAGLALIGLVNHTLYLGLSYIGMGQVPAGLTAVIVSANPVLTTLLAALLLNERITWRVATGLLLGSIGVLMILQHRVNAGAERWIDLVWPLGALVALSSGAILFKRLGDSRGGFATLAVQLAAAALGALPAALLLEGRMTLTGLPAAFWWSMAFQSLLASVGAYAIWFHLLRSKGASAASAWHFLIPPLGILAGVILLDETVVWADLIGLVPVAIGIRLVNRPADKATTAPR